MFLITSSSQPGLGQSWTFDRTGGRGKKLDFSQTDLGEEGVPDNVLFTAGPGAELDFDRPVAEVRS